MHQPTPSSPPASLTNHFRRLITKAISASAIGNLEVVPQMCTCACFGPAIFSMWKLHFILPNGAVLGMYVPYFLPL